MVITSKDNETIKMIKKMKNKKYRNGCFIIEGIKMLQEAINENANIQLIVVCESTKIDLDITKYKNIEVTKKIFDELTDVVTPQGVLAIIKINNNKSDIDLSQDYILALDGIQDPGNLGTIIRTADSANIKQIIVSKNTVDAYSSKVIRSTMGGIFRVNIIEVDDLSETLQNMKENRFEIVTTSLATENSIYDVNYSKKVVVIGNEANGVSQEIQNISNIKVKIPMFGKTESLNASVAAGIMIYEYVRQNIEKK